MLHSGIFLWAIVAAACLATAKAGLALTKSIWGEQHPVGTGGGALRAAYENRRAAKSLERRRSERIPRNVSVFAYSHAPGESPFYEEATTSEISSHGGLLTLAANVCVGQKLLLTNVVNQEERECYVVRFTRKQRQKGEVAIEFTQSAPDFWKMRSERPAGPTSGAWSSR